MVAYSTTDTKVDFSPVSGGVYYAQFYIIQMLPLKQENYIRLPIDYKEVTKLTILVSPRNIIFLS